MQLPASLDTLLQIVEILDQQQHVLNVESSQQPVLLQHKLQLVKQTISWSETNVIHVELTAMDLWDLVLLLLLFHVPLDMG